MTASVTARLRSRAARWPALSLPAGWAGALACSAGVFAVVRVALFALSAAAWGLSAEHPSVTPAGSYPVLTSGWHNIITSWDKQDANWFLLIAGHGYAAAGGSASFYPGYPLAVRLAGYLTGGHLLAAGYLVSSAALIAGLAVVYRLTELEFGAEFARRSVVCLAVFPTAFFLFDTYSESLFLLAAAGSIYLARTGRWGWAALAGIAATATRSLGVVVVAALAAEAIHQAVAEHRAGGGPAGRGLARGLAGRTALRLGAAALPLAGIGGYLAFWQLRFGDWSRPFALEKTLWYRQFSLPWATLWHGLVLAWQQGPVGGDAWWTLDFVLVAAGLALAVWVALRARPVYAVYTWASFLLFLAEAEPSRPLASDPRYLVTIFPLAWALAAAGRRPAVHEAIIGLSAAAMAIVAWLFLVTVNVF